MPSTRISQPAQPIDLATVPAPAAVIPSVHESRRSSRFWLPRLNKLCIQAGRIAAALLTALALATSIPTPTDAATPARPRVALQAGHWKATESPYPFSIQTGTSAAGVDEWKINLDVAQRTAAILQDEGISAEVLPTWFPLGYSADVFVAIHVNGSPDPNLRGFFADRSATSTTPEVDDRLVSLINSTYRAAVPIPYVYRPTNNSQHYYAYAHLTRSTPAALIELGFLTNEADRAVLTTQTNVIARALATAIERFLHGPAKAGLIPDAPAATDTSPAATVSKVTAAAVAPSGRPGTIRVEWGGGAMLRSQPSRSGEPLAVIPDQERVGVLGTALGEPVDPDASDWNLVEWRGQQGYVYGRLVTTDSGAATAAPTPAPKVVRASTGRIQVDWGGGAVLRREPTRDSTPLAVIPDSDTVEVLATAAGDDAEPGDPTWRLVRWQGLQGYVYGRLVDLLEHRQSR